MLATDHLSLDIVLPQPTTIMRETSCCGHDDDNQNSRGDSLCRRLPWYWLPALLLSGASWYGSYYVHQDCSFVILSQQPLDEGEEVVYIRRGTTRGQLTPQDACQPWGDYDNLTLDSNMLLAKYSSLLPLILGAIIMAILLFMYPCLTVELICLRAFFQWTCTLLALASAILQALTHFMVPSNMCHESPLIQSEGYSCENTTTAYYVTFITMAGKYCN